MVLIPSTFTRRHITITGRQTLDANPDSPSIVYVPDIAHLGLRRLRHVRAVVCSAPLPNHHNEVICRTLGIPVVIDPTADPREGATERLSFERAIPRSTVWDKICLSDRAVQLSVFDPVQIRPTPAHPTTTFFIRFEHQVLASLREGEPLTTSLLRMKERIAEFAKALTPGQRLLIRGLDVRSDDLILAPLLNHRKEPNPELGLHGARYLIESPEWVQFEASVFDGLGDNVAYAVPFVTSRAEFDTFLLRYSHLFPERTLVAFAEAPSIGFEIAEYAGEQVGIGLKDISQFIFAADRGVTSRPATAPLTRAPLPEFVRHLVIEAQRGDVRLSVHQTLDSLPQYATYLAGMPWTPSLTAPDYALIASGEGEDR